MQQLLRWLLLWSLASPLSSLAQAPATSAPAADGSAYERLVDDAVEEFRRRNFAEARSLFARANALQPSARTLRGLGMTELELGNFVDSSELLQGALDSKVRPLEGALRRETEALLARAEGFIGRFTVIATPVPPTTVLVDGAQARLREGGVLLVPVGDHTLELVAPGYLTAKIVKKVQGGERETLPVVLQRPEAIALPVVVPPEPAPLAPAPAALPRQDAGPRRRLVRSPWLWTGVGVLVTGTAVGLALALRKDAKIDDPIARDPVAIQKGP